MVPVGVTTWLNSLDSDIRALVDIETDLCIVLDQYGSIIRVNPAFEQRLGYSESDVLRHDIIRYVAVEDLAKFLHSFDARPPGELPPVIRLLKRDHGCIMARLVANRFRESRGYLIFRPVADTVIASPVRGASWSQ